MSIESITGRTVMREAVRGQRGRVLTASALFSGHQAGEALVPVIIGVIVDRVITPGGDVGELVRWLVVLGAVFGTLSFGYRFGSRRAETAAERAAHELRLRLARRILDARGGADEGRLPGELAGVATSDAGRVGAVCSGLPLEGAVLALSGVFLALVALVGGRLALRGDITVGDLVAAVGLAQFLLGPLSVFAWVNSEFARGRAGATRVAAVLGSRPAVATGNGVTASPVRGRMRLSDVAHGGLKGIDLDAAPGEFLGVVTADPADGAALLRCLGREVDPETGTVELDGVDLTTLDPLELRSVVLVAGHDAPLFGGTLAENVGEGPGLAAVMSASGADEVARTLPDGAGSVLAERGGNLSGGQRQRVALARALATRAPVLVLHDPTTAVDTVTEARIATRLRDLRRDATTILVTTSPALLAVTDRVVLLAGGRVEAEGTHPDLTGRHSGYRTAVLA